MQPRGRVNAVGSSGNPGGMYRHPFLSDAQREAIESAHFDLDEREIARYWTLSDQDLLRIDRRRRDSTASDSLFNSASFVFPAGHRKGETAFLYRSCSMSASNCESSPTISSNGSRGLQTLSVYFSGFRLPWPTSRALRRIQRGQLVRLR